MGEWFIIVSAAVQVGYAKTLMIMDGVGRTPCPAAGEPAGAAVGRQPHCTRPIRTAGEATGGMGTNRVPCDVGTNPPD